MVGSLCRLDYAGRQPDLVGRRVFKHNTPSSVIEGVIDEFKKEYKELHYWPYCWEPVLIGITRGD